MYPNDGREQLKSSYLIATIRISFIDSKVRTTLYSVCMCIKISITTALEWSHLNCDPFAFKASSQLNLAIRPSYGPLVIICTHLPELKLMESFSCAKKKKKQSHYLAGGCAHAQLDEAIPALY